MSEKKKFSAFDECSCFVCLRRENKQKTISVCLSVRGTFAVDTITFEGISGSKQKLVGVFYVRRHMFWCYVLVFKSKIKSWSWSWSWSRKTFLFRQKLWGITPKGIAGFPCWTCPQTKKRFALTISKYLTRNEFSKICRPVAAILNEEW